MSNLRVLQEVKTAHGSDRPFVSCKMLDAYGDENEQVLRDVRGCRGRGVHRQATRLDKVDGADFIGAYYGEIARDVRRDLQDNSTTRVACPMPFTTMAVRSNGDVSPCCVDFIGGTNLGNVDSSTLSDIWNSEAWYQFQKQQLEDRKDENPSCARCDIYRSDHYTLDNIDGFPVERLRRTGRLGDSADEWQETEDQHRHRLPERRGQPAGTVRPHHERAEGVPRVHLRDHRGGQLLYGRQPDILRRIAAKDRNFKVILNANNFGPVRSGYNAFLQASGDAVVLMSSDLQDPPELITEMIRKMAGWLSGGRGRQEPDSGQVRDVSGAAVLLLATVEILGQRTISSGTSRASGSTTAR